ncbi:23S rRNA (pseudouridine(1915)-N(3))-methyltransferase RlmH [Leptolyngbya cf. ectocarpi LEGE 11479]|uniref:Ribosomal RNA large subunit methyltransferase H n=1 Tax=Leptolyngbya cf. ectocarpi LEGE 11479 TaxID=1828722 RepID=A0A928ZSW0_LEPEC|nr:23S rRNA (pseudouridine(1915)-N(3))-methyltransferase RlmH [Leptolyngbya ectocarpi]MBE9066927.1 23S rRNA (pseudouridine(1915)-N(3))-methyltransferase RlmH [Leptolyngbya cf. ectocarpi LEGE 11479]
MGQSFPKVRIIAVGKVKKGWLKDGIGLYTQRLPEIELLEIKDTDPETEAQKVLASLKTYDKLVVLSEDGQHFDSVAFGHWLGQEASGTLVFFLGGPTGVSHQLKQKAYQVLSLSAMTFPHELARLLLLEQLYRGKTILQGGRYHK